MWRETKGLERETFCPQQLHTHAIKIKIFLFLTVRLAEEHLCQSTAIELFIFRLCLDIRDNKQGWLVKTNSSNRMKFYFDGVGQQAREITFYWCQAGNLIFCALCGSHTEKKLHEVSYRIKTCWIRYDFTITYITSISRYMAVIFVIFLLRYTNFVLKAGSLQQKLSFPPKNLNSYPLIH